jgi:putative transposase
MKQDHSIALLCQAFAVSKSGYYDWQERQRQPGPRQQEDRELKGHIRQFHQQSRATYGAPRIQACLRTLGRRHGRNRIGRLMREEQICGRQRRRYRVRTTDSNHDQPIAPNRLAAASSPTAPDQVWLGDITYIPTAEGWLYLASILDRYSRKVVGWAMSQHIDTALVTAAWNQACCHRQPAPGLIFHSDRGVQYASAAFRQSLQESGTLPSMSRKANCYDNAIMEAFWSTLKLELVYRQPENFSTRQQARAALFDYIEVFYNRQRLHSALGYQSPAAFELSRN